MLSPTFTLLYVDSPKTSGEFYAGLLGRKPVDASPTFVMFALDHGQMLGLWSRHSVTPGATAVGGGELGFPVENDAAVESICVDWKKRGVTIAQEPINLDFGRTFVALDPDGHRLRVFAPAENGKAA